MESQVAATVSQRRGMRRRVTCNAGRRHQQEGGREPADAVGEHEKLLAGRDAIWKGNVEGLGDFPDINEGVQNIQT